MSDAKRSGYVALLGRTNAGKSTFLNSILQVKVSIVSDKPQTTRRQILGIKTTEKGQIIFFDSPGIHKPHHKLNEKMMKDVHHSLHDADIILYFIDIDDTREDSFAISLFEDSKKPVFLIINKIDKYSKGKILKRIDFFKDLFQWHEIVPISALKGDNIDLLEELIYRHLPEGEWFYSDEDYTKQSEKFYLSELVREKILQLTRQELPYTTTVRIEELKDRGNIIYIRAEIYVESQSQKKIVIGKHGGLIKSMGERAREEIEGYFEKKVFLDLFVKVVPDWRNKALIIKDLYEG